MYVIFKVVMAIGIIACSTRIGILLSKKYKYRLEELDEFKNIFRIIENKIKYTYEPLEEIFREVSEISSIEISGLLLNTSKNLKEKGTMQAWNDAIKTANLFVKNEDKKILKEFGTMLGKVNKEGQINQINLQIELLDRQIIKAQKEREKNEVVYQKLGLILGIGITIIFI